MVNHPNVVIISIISIEVRVFNSFLNSPVVYASSGQGLQIMTVTCRQSDGWTIGSIGD